LDETVDIDELLRFDRKKKDDASSKDNIDFSQSPLPVATDFNLLEGDIRDESDEGRGDGRRLGVARLKIFTRVSARLALQTTLRGLSVPWG
jgi:hypothetical protein